MSTQPDRLGWGAGWPHCQANKMAWLTRADGFRQPFRHEVVPLIAALMNATEKQGYDIRPDWSWGFNCRAVRGSDVASFHSWGLALDINAPTNPMMHGSPGWKWLHDHRRTDMPEWVPPLWKSHGFEWGGDYAHRQDAMHMGFALTPADCQRITAQLSHPIESPIRLTKTLHTGARGPIVGHVQDLLRWYSVKYGEPDTDPGPSDSVYGPRTGRAMLAFKHHVHDLETAFKGRLTFHLPVDNTCGRIALGALEFWAAARQ